MIAIDGSTGEGRGQIVRTSLALSLLTGQDVQISNLRANRKKPGLRAQHSMAVSAAAEIGKAVVTGNEVGSREIRFCPTGITPGEYQFRIPTAGSATLIMQTVLPALMLCSQPSSLILGGGTHNAMAPTFDFLKNSFLPQLRKFGPDVQLTLNRHGFYPAGGGEFSAVVTPVEALGGLQLLQRGKLVRRRICSVVSKLPLKVAQRETDRVIRKLNWDRYEVQHVECPRPFGPGNVLMVELEYENVTTGFTSFGERGVTAEKVADRIVRKIKDWQKSDAAVGPHLADQILLPMAIAAHFNGVESAFVTGALTEHTRTQADIISRFLNVDVTVLPRDKSTFRVDVAPNT